MAIKKMEAFVSHKPLINKKQPPEDLGLLFVNFRMPVSLMPGSFSLVSIPDQAISTSAARRSHRNHDHLWEGADRNSAEPVSR